MKHRALVMTLIASALAILSPNAFHASAQEEAPTKAKAKGKAKSSPTPRMPDGKVDFTNIWTADRTFIYDIHEALTPGEDLPLQPWALKLAKERLSKDDP